MTLRRDPFLAMIVGIVFLGTMPAWDRIFEDTSWRAPTLFAALAALSVAAVLRRLRAGVVVSLTVSLLALLSLGPWLIGATPLPMLPTVQAWDILAANLSQGLVDIEETRAPAPSYPGLVLTLVLGAWLLTHVSHELLVRWRRPALAAAPLTAWWIIALAVPMPSDRVWPHTVAFLAALLLGMLLTATDDNEQAELPVRLPMPGVIAGVLALSLAAAAPGMLPGYEASPWTDLGGGGNNPRGYQPIVDVSERLQLPEERDLLRVQASQRTYLRTAGLDTFDGSTWRLGPPGEGSYRPDSSSLYAASDVLPPEQPASRTEAVFVEVDVLELANIYAPAPYQPVEVLGSQRNEMVWSTEGGFLATWDTTTDGQLGGADRTGIREGVTYSIQAARPTPTRDDLLDVEYDPSTLARWTQLPREYTALREEAEAIYADAGAEEVVDKVLALQDWFVGDGGGFTYDLDVPALRGEAALERFVLEDKVGYCEYFATAMAVMLRETGIPSRVAVGFLPGRVTQEPTAERELTEYTVSTADAHAWVEVLFPGAGWITFEPTPRSDESQTVPSALDLAPVESEAERREREREELGDDGGSDASSLPIPDLPEDLFPDGQNLREQQAVPDEASGVRNLVIALVVSLIVAGLVVLGIRLRRRLSWRHDGTPAGRVLAAQRRLLGTAARYGVGRRPEETSLEVVARWRSEHRIDRRGTQFARTAQSAAFGGHVDEALAHQAELMVAELEQMLRESVPPRDRLVAPIVGSIDAVRSGSRRVGARLRDR